jgi:hypothetical protein
MVSRTPKRTRPIMIRPAHLERNYQKMDQLLGIDLVDHPELALQLGIATEILFTGMIDGMFTGRTLGKFFSATRDDWFDARTIINEHDRAGEIAQYGHKLCVDKLYDRCPAGCQRHG